MDYAIAKTRDVLVELIPDSAPGDEISFRDELHRSIGKLGNDFELYGFCFSEKPNELSLWREYGAKGSGYSIGFEPSNLYLQVADYLERNAKMMLPVFNRVLYEPEQPHSCGRI